MASSWFLILAFKCLHHVAWPLLALVHPMCASVQAIETDSYEQTKDLISYWILLSLIYLFEYAFMSLLPWFQLWMYIKLMFIFWLTIPDFGRASDVVNNLIHSMKLQMVTWRLNNFRGKGENDKDILIYAERYMKENGTEGFGSEKLIASKNTMCRSNAETTKEIIAIDNKEVPKDIHVMPKIVTSQNASSATLETKETTKESDIESSIHELTCALCFEIATGQEDLTSHLNERKHNDGFEADLCCCRYMVEVDVESFNDWRLTSQNASSATLETKETMVEDSDTESSTHELTCALCYEIANQEDLTSHLNERKHEDGFEADLCCCRHIVEVEVEVESTNDWVEVEVESTTSPQPQPNH